MSSFNLCVLLGRLVREPELRYTPNNVAVCAFSLALDHRHKDQSGEWVSRPSFIDCKLFGKRAEAFEKHHRKGSVAHIQGRLEQSRWEDKSTGKPRSKVGVVVEDWQFVGGKDDRKAPARQQQTQDFGADPGAGFEGAEGTPF